VTKVLSTAEVKRAIEGSGKDFGKSTFLDELRNVDWNIVDEIPHIDTAVIFWNKLLLDVAERHAPTKRTRIKGCHVPWMTSVFKHLCRNTTALSVKLPNLILLLTGPNIKV
jgi:hypothetical protein